MGVLIAWLKQHPLPAFFGLAYAFSWLVTLPLLIGQNGLGLAAYTVPGGVSTLLVALQSFGPLLAALVMSTVTGSGAGRLLRQYARFRVGAIWYLFALAGPLLAVLLGATAIRGAEAWQLLFPEGWLDGLMLLLTYLLNLVVLFFPFGPFGEEGGWRGFALPRLQRRYEALAASLILSVFWMGWHLPLFFIPEAGTWTGSLLLFALVQIALSILHTWVYNGAQASLFVVTLLHAAVNASTRAILPEVFAVSRAEGNLAAVIAFGVWALLVVVLTRAKLGYQAETPTETNL